MNERRGESSSVRRWVRQYPPPLPRLIAGAIVAGLFAVSPWAAVQAQAPLCSSATYGVWDCVQPCPYWPDPGSLGCVLKQGHYCASGKPVGEPTCAYQNCPLAYYCDRPGTTIANCGALQPTENCGKDSSGNASSGDGIDNDANGCVDDGCVVGKPPCSCKKSCKTPACGAIGSCDVREGKKEICGDGKDNNCDKKIDEGCVPPGGGGGGGGGGGPPPGPPPPPPPPCGGKGGKDPILLAGRIAVTEPFTDFSATAVARLSISRTWNSNDTSFFGGRRGILGSGWHHEWEATLTCDGDGCTVARGAQEGFRFVPAETAPSLDGTETWQLYRPPADDTSGARRHLLAKRPGGSWSLFMADGTTLEFATVCDTCGTPDTFCTAPEAGGTARLVRTVDARGNGVNVSYGRGVGLLLGLTDDLGHSLELRSNTACVDGLARELFFDGMRVATYEYQGADLARAIDADGAVLRAYSYDPEGTGLLLAVHDESGSPIVEFAYDGDGDAIGIVDEATTMMLSYAADGTVSVSESYGASVSSGQRKFDLSGNLLSISEGCSCGGVKTFTYQGDDLVCSKDAAGSHVYDGLDALGRVIRHARYAGGTCPPAATPLGGTAEEEWRTYGVAKAVAQGVNLALDLVTSVSRTSTLSTANKATESWDYDPAPKSYDPLDYACAEAPLPAGAVICRHIQAGYVNAPTGVVFERHATFYSYDGRGRLTRTIGPVNLDRPSPTDVMPVEDRLYWPESETLARRGKLGEVRRYASPTSAPLATTFDYDLFGLYRAWQPDGRFTTWIKDGRGRSRFVLESDGRSAETRFHDGEKPRLRISNGGAVDRTSFDSRGRVTAEERLSCDPDASGPTPTVLWGEYHQHDPAGNRTHSERRDGTGAVVWKQDREFDVQHRLVKESHPEVAGAARSCEYGATGFLTRTTDEEGRATIFTPDGLGRVTQVTRSGFDAAGLPVSASVAQYTYQPYTSALSQVLDGKGLATSYQRDDFGWMSPLTSPNLKAGPVSFAYDARGNLLKRADQYVTVSYTYDGMDRVLTTSAVNSVDGSSILQAYVYDEPPALGRLTSVEEPERTVSFAYDSSGRLTSETMTENGTTIPLVTTYVHAPDGALSEIVYPTGLRVRWVRNPVTREVVEVKDAVTGAAFATQIRRLPGGPVKGLVFGNGLTLDQTFNTRVEPQTIASGPLALGYGMTPAGDVGSITEGASTRTFQFDFLDRLTGSSGWLAYTLDGVGNRRLDSVDGIETTYATARDRLTAVNPGYAYRGCYTTMLANDLIWSGATAETCVAAARGRGYKFAGLWNGGRCNGGGLPPTKVADGECNKPCTTNAEELCGGSTRSTVYELKPRERRLAVAYDRQSNVSAIAATPGAPVTTYRGCYTDSATRALPVQLMSAGATVAKCAEAALANGLKYAGLQWYGYCFGGNTLGYTKVADSECSTPCTANPSEKCGGSYRNSIHEAQPAPPPPGLCLRHDALGRLVMAGTPSVPVTVDGTTCTVDSDVAVATARFKYDHRNRRVATWKLETGEWVYTVFGPGGEPLAEIAKTTNPASPWRPVREYVWLEGKPIAQIERDAVTGASRVYAIHVDQIGLPRALTSPSGAVVWTANPARPYGDITEVVTPDPETGRTVVTNLRLPGQYDERLLSSVGLQGPYYNWNRWYLPSVGRYLELDPIAKRGGFNTRYGVDWYNYAGGNPLSEMNPEGLTYEDCIALGNNPQVCQWSNDRPTYRDGTVPDVCFSECIKKVSKYCRIPTPLKWVGLLEPEVAWGLALACKMGAFKYCEHECPTKKQCPAQ